METLQGGGRRCPLGHLLQLFVLARFLVWLAGGNTTLGKRSAVSTDRFGDLDLPEATPQKISLTITPSDELNGIDIRFNKLAPESRV